MRIEFSCVTNAITLPSISIAAATAIAPNPIRDFYSVAYSADFAQTFLIIDLCVKTASSTNKILLFDFIILITLGNLSFFSLSIFLN